MDPPFARGMIFYILREKNEDVNKELFLSLKSAANTCKLAIGFDLGRMISFRLTTIHRVQDPHHMPLTLMIITNMRRIDNECMHSLM